MNTALLDPPAEAVKHGSSTDRPILSGASDCSGPLVSLRVQRLREALQRPEYKAKKSEELKKRREAGWKPKTNTPAAIAARERVAERLRGVKRKPEHIAGMLAANAKRRKPKPIPRPCECGCGGMTVTRFIHGHNHKGIKHSATWKAKQSEGLRRAYQEGKFQHIVNQSAEFIEKRVRSLRGRVRPEATCKATSEGVKKAWAEGKYHTEAVINNRKVNLSRVGASAEQMNVIRQKVDMEKLKATNSEKLKSQMAEWKAEGKLDAIRRKAGNAKGMPDHLAAKQWHIRSPMGEVYHFSNLAAWARRNKHLFVDDREHSKTPFWKRIAGGITDLLKSNGRSCSYRGWVAVGKSEHVNGAPDLLGRDVSVQNDLDQRTGRADLGNHD